MPLTAPMRVIRLLITDLVGEAASRESITTIREGIGDLLGRLEEPEAGASRLPPRTKYLLLVFGFLRRLLAPEPVSLNAVQAVQ